MRSSFLSLITIGLALISLGVSSAAAQNASVRGQGGGGIDDSAAPIDCGVPAVDQAGLCRAIVPGTSKIKP